MAAGLIGCGIRWSELTEEKIAAIPLLRALRPLGRQ
jgi:hypothetical protein